MLMNLIIEFFVEIYSTEIYYMNKWHKSNYIFSNIIIYEYFSLILIYIFIH